MGIRILLIEDNAALCGLLCDRLSACGFDVQTAAQGPDALRLLMAGAVDLILTDNELPGLTGLELCHKLRRGAGLTERSVPIWLMTGSHDVDLARKAVAAGVARLIRKPFRLDDVCVDIHRMLAESAPPAAPVSMAHIA